MMICIDFQNSRKEEMGTQGGQVGGGTELESNEESYLDRGSHYEGG